MKTTTWMLSLLACALPALWAADANAGGYCDAKVLCTLATEVCHGGQCVPKSKLCTTDSTCSAWQKCDFTCSWAMSSGSSGGGTTTSPADAGVAYADASSSGGGSGSSGSSGGASPPAEDAGSAKKAPDASMMDIGAMDPPEEDTVDAPPVPICPKDVGVCIVEPKKVAIQGFCLDFCAAVLACDGGGNSTEPSQPPKPSADAGSATSVDASAGFAPKQPDAGSSEDQAMPEDAGSAGTDAGMGVTDIEMPKPDGGSGSESELGQCMLFCSVLALEKVAPAEFTAFQQCVIAQKGSCDSMKAQCSDEADSFEDAAEADTSWMLGLGGMGGSATGAELGGPKDSDATSQPQSPDSATNGGTQDATGDTTAGAPSGTAGTGNAAAAGPSGGCTAGSRSSPAGIAGLMLLLAGAWLLRRRAVRVG